MEPRDPVFSQDQPGGGRTVTVSEQRLNDALELVEQRQRREHMRTRAWVIFFTAPAWGSVVGAAFGIPNVTTIAASSAAVLYLAALKLAKLGLLFH